MIDKIDAIRSLNPNAEFVIVGDEIKWTSAINFTDTQINAELTRLQNLYNSKEYQRMRAIEYPPIVDYLDAIVKGDTTQQQVYIDACLAVKAKYPKGL